MKTATCRISAQRSKKNPIFLCIYVNMCSKPPHLHAVPSNECCRTSPPYNLSWSCWCWSRDQQWKPPGYIQQGSVSRRREGQFQLERQIQDKTSGRATGKEILKSSNEVTFLNLFVCFFQSFLFYVAQLLQRPDSRR